MYNQKHPDSGCFLDEHEHISVIYISSCDSPEHPIGLVMINICRSNDKDMFRIGLVCMVGSNADDYYICCVYLGVSVYVESYSG